MLTVMTRSMDTTEAALVRKPRVEGSYIITTLLTLYELWTLEEWVLAKEQYRLYGFRTKHVTPLELR